MDNYTGLQNRYNDRMFCEEWSCGEQREITLLKGETIKTNDLDHQIAEETSAVSETMNGAWRTGGSKEWITSIEEHEKYSW